MANEGLRIFYELSQSIAKETKKKFKLRSNQFQVHAMGYSGDITDPDCEGLKYLAKSQQYTFHSWGVLRIKVRYKGIKINHDQVFVITHKKEKIFLFMAESGPEIVLEKPKKKLETQLAASIVSHLLMSIFDHFKKVGTRMYMCSTKAPLSSFHYYIVPLN